MSTTQPKERPIPFLDLQVRAILEGRQTQTRRIVKPQPVMVQETYDSARLENLVPCPYGEPGDRLRVRETWAPMPGGPVTPESGVLYRADGHAENWLWRPSIHMPRWASRITLEIVAVWVEWVRGITRGDAMNEGCPHSNMAHGPSSIDWYRSLWESINGAGSWDANPWVWVIEFKVCGANGSNGGGET